MKFNTLEELEQYSFKTHDTDALAAAFDFVADEAQVIAERAAAVRHITTTWYQYVFGQPDWSDTELVEAFMTIEAKIRSDSVRHSRYQNFISRYRPTKKDLAQQRNTE